MSHWFCSGGKINQDQAFDINYNSDFLDCPEEFAIMKLHKW